MYVSGHLVHVQDYLLPFLEIINLVGYLHGLPDSVIKKIFLVLRRLPEVVKFTGSPFAFEVHFNNMSL